MIDRTAGSASQNAEITEKLQRIEDLLDRNKAGAVLLSRHGNIAWITAGQVEARVAQGTETAVCSLLLTRNGRRYYLAPNNEAARLHDEEFAGLGYSPSSTRGTKARPAAYKNSSATPQYAPTHPTATQSS